jgi:membrane-bound lytic murein transglycosylase MltF
MAYNDEGQWIGFHPEFDDEDRAALDNVDRNEQAKQYRMAQANNASYQQAINDATGEALKELGIPPEEWASINQSLPLEEQKKAVVRGTKKYVRKVAAAAKRKKAGAQSAKGQPQASKPEAVNTAREKVSTGGQLSSAEELDVLAAVLGDDFLV